MHGMSAGYREAARIIGSTGCGDHGALAAAATGDAKYSDRRDLRQIDSTGWLAAVADVDIDAVG